MTTKEQLIAELRSLSNYCWNEAEDLESGATLIAASYDIRRKFERVDELNEELAALSEPKEAA